MWSWNIAHSPMKGEILLGIAISQFFWAPEWFRENGNVAFCFPVLRQKMYMKMITVHSGMVVIVWTISWKLCTVETASRRIWDWLLRVPSQGYHHFHYDSLNLSRPNISQHQLMTWITHTETLRLMDEILHHLECMKPYKSWDIYHINFCRISSINSMYLHLLRLNIPCIFSCLGFLSKPGLMDWQLTVIWKFGRKKSWKKHTVLSCLVWQ